MDNRKTPAAAMIPASGESAGLARPDPWIGLRHYTNARIALGRAGNSLPTKEVLQFSLAHAMARDAVYWRLDREALLQGLDEAGFETLCVNSRATDRQAYLLRPDLGRRLDARCLSELQQAREGEADLSIVLADGLSPLALQKHALPLLSELRPLLPAQWKLGPVVLASQARVALGDEIGECVGAKLVLLLVGERPGLSSPDSLGAYLTLAPRVGRMDSERNCVSNIRPQGLTYPDAAHRIAWLLMQARLLGQSGVALKDESQARPALGGNGSPSVTGTDRTFEE